MKLLKNEILNKYSNINIGGTAKFLIIVYTLDDIREAINFADKNKMPYKLIGLGSNIFFNDYYNGVIIINKYRNIQILDSFPTKYNKNNTNTKLICASSGDILLDFIKYCSKNNFNISELAGIPGTIGGAVYNNAGAYGKEISDYFEGCTYIDSDLQIKLFNLDDLKFKYRSSFLKKKQNIILLNVYFKLPIGNSVDIDKNINDIIAIRNNKLPITNNIGCIFKNIILTNYKLVVGKMLEDIGVKEMYYKNLKISKHANIIINTTKSSPSDLINFINIIKNKFMDKYSIDLKLEIEII